MSETTVQPSTGLRSRMDELARIEAETAAAPTLQAMAEMNAALIQTARDLAAISREMDATARQMLATATRRMFAVVGLALIVGTLAGGMSAFVMKSRLGGVSFPEWSNSRLR